MMTNMNKVNNTTTTESEIETRKRTEESINKWASGIIDHKVKMAVNEKIKETIGDIEATVKAAVGDIKIEVNPTINITVNPSITVGGSVAIDERRIDNDIEAIARLLEIVTKK